MDGYIKRAQQAQTHLHLSFQPIYKINASAKAVKVAQTKEEFVSSDVVEMGRRINGISIIASGSSRFDFLQKKLSHSFK
jgi:hypothetical protein